MVNDDKMNRKQKNILFFAAEILCATSLVVATVISAVKGYNVLAFLGVAGLAVCAAAVGFYLGAMPKKEKNAKILPLITKKGQRILHTIAAAPHIVWAIMFIVLPLVIVIFYAFTGEDETGNLIFTFENILALPEYAPIFGVSLELSVIATFICLIIGYPMAYIIAKMSAKAQKICIMLMMLPMWTNLLIRTYSIMAIFDDGGFLNQLLGTNMHIIGTKGAVIFGMVYDFLPYMVLPIYTCISKIDKNMWEAAEDLGCNTVKTLTKVIFPLSMSGIISGVTMVFVPSISTFYISQKLGGGTFQLIGDTIEYQFVNGALNTGAAISFVMMILILISLSIMNKFGDADEGGIIV